MGAIPKGHTSGQLDVCVCVSSDLDICINRFNRIKLNPKI